MGSTTDLRRQLKADFDPFVAVRGFARDDRDSPQRQIYRRIRGERLDVFDIQWEKYGLPRFVVNYGTGSSAGLERADVTPPEAVTRQLCELFGEFDAFWADGTIGAHMTTRASRGKAPVAAIRAV